MTPTAAGTFSSAVSDPIRHPGVGFLNEKRWRLHERHQSQRRHAHLMVRARSLEKYFEPDKLTGHRIASRPIIAWRGRKGLSPPWTTVAPTSKLLPDGRLECAHRGVCHDGSGKPMKIPSQTSPRLYPRHEGKGSSIARRTTCRRATPTRQSSARCVHVSGR